MKKQILDIWCIYLVVLYEAYLPPFIVTGVRTSKLSYQEAVLLI